MLLKSRGSLTCFRASLLPGRAKDLSAPRYHRFASQTTKNKHRDGKKDTTNIPYFLPQCYPHYPTSNSILPSQLLSTLSQPTFHIIFPIIIHIIPSQIPYYLPHYYPHYPISNSILPSQLLSTLSHPKFHIIFPIIIHVITFQFPYYPLTYPYKFQVIFPFRVFFLTKILDVPFINPMHSTRPTCLILIHSMKSCPADRIVKLSA